MQFQRKPQTVSAWQLPETTVVQTEDTGTFWDHFEIPGWLNDKINGGLIEAQKSGVTADFPQGIWYLTADLVLDDGERMRTFVYANDWITCDGAGRLAVYHDSLFKDIYERIPA